MISKSLCGLSIVFLLLVAGCSPDYKLMGKHRTEYAKKNQGDIVIAVIQEPGSAHYINGIRLAVEEINQSSGRLLGRTVKLQFEQGHQTFKSAISSIERIVRNPKASLVLGHKYDEIIFPASLIYEHSQLLFFPSSNSPKKLTSYGSLFTFCMLPDTIHTAEQISKKSLAFGYKKIVILYARADKHRKFALLFEQEAAKRGIKLMLNHAFHSQTDDYRPFLSDLRKKNFDAVFLSADIETSARMIRQMREMEIKTPVFGTDALNSEQFIKAVGIAGNNTIIPTAYNVQSEDTINQDFIARYRDEFHQIPDTDAAQGYDAVMLFVDKVTIAGTTSPNLLASTAHFSPAWTGVTGTHQFSKNGDIEGKQIFFQKLNNKKWQLLN